MVTYYRCCDIRACFNYGLLTHFMSKWIFCRVIGQIQSVQSARTKHLFSTPVFNLYVLYTSFPSLCSICTYCTPLLHPCVQSVRTVHLFSISVFNLYVLYTSSPSLCSGYSIQFMSKSGQWLCVASSLTNYLRLAVVHLGIQQWPLHLTTGCVSSHLRVSGIL